MILFWNIMKYKFRHGNANDWSVIDSQQIGNISALFRWHRAWTVNYISPPNMELSVTVTNQSKTQDFPVTSSFYKSVAPFINNFITHLVARPLPLCPYFIGVLTE